MPSSEVMHKWKHGKLHSGSETGPEVKSQKQALAIMFSERRAEAKHGGKYPEKRASGGPVTQPPPQRPPLSPAMQAIRDRIARGEMKIEQAPTWAPDAPDQRAFGGSLPPAANPMMSAPGSYSTGAMTPMAGVAGGMSDAMGPMGIAPGQMSFGNGQGFGQPGGNYNWGQMERRFQDSPRWQNNPGLQQAVQRMQSMQGGGPPPIAAGQASPPIAAPPIAAITAPQAMPPPPIGVANQPSGAMPMIGQPNATSQMIGQALAIGGVAQPGVGNFNMAKQANVTPSPMMRSEQRSVMHGPVMSAVPGRTDAHKTAVPSGSYVIPSDVVSGRGQGNTLAGMNVLQRMFKMGPYGTPGGSLRPGRTMPGAMRPPKMMRPLTSASGGGKQSGHVGKPTPVDVAGGELVVPPQNLMQTVHPNLETAHKIMDKWVVNERKRHIKTLSKLPGPVKD